MSNYTKLVNYIVKDALPSGNTGKIIRGTELDNEFSAIASAVATKVDANGGTLSNGAITNSTASLSTLSVSGSATLQGLGNKLGVSGTGSEFSVNPATSGSLNNVAIGGTTPLAAAFTNLSYSGTLTGGTGVINIGSGQVFKDAAGNVGIGTATPAYKLSLNSATAIDVESGVTNPNGLSRFGTRGSGNAFLGSFTSGKSLELFSAGSLNATLDSAGNLGLGVQPSAWGSGFKALELSGGNAFYSNGGQASIASNAFNDGVWKYKTTSTAGLFANVNGAFQFFTAPSGTAGAPITFTQAMTLDASGNLQVKPGNIFTEATSGIFFTGTVGDFRNGIYGIGTNNVAISANGSERARITAAGYFKASNTGVYSGNGLSITGTYHQFVQGNANDSNLVASSSNIGTGTIFDAHSNTQASGFSYQAVSAGSVVYRVLTNGNVQNTNNSYGAISDIKLKENITDATPKLASLNQLRVVNYNLIGSELKQIGLIAQEVEQVFPGLVESTPDTVEVTKTRTVEVPAVLDEEGNEVTPATTREETYTEREPNGEVTKAVKYSVLVPMLLKAVQELSAQNAALESRLADLEAKLSNN